MGYARVLCGAAERDDGWFFGTDAEYDTKKRLARMDTASFDNACAVLALVHEDDIDDDFPYKGVVEGLNIDLEGRDDIALLVIAADPKGVAKWTKNNKFETRVQLARVLLNSWELNTVRAEIRAKRKNGES